MQPVNVCYGLQVERGQMAAIARDLPAAERLIQPAYEYLRARRTDSPEWAEALVAQGDLLSLKSDNQTSFERYEEAMAVRARLWGPQSVRLAKERYELAVSLAQVGRYSQAIHEMKLAYQSMVAALGEKHFNSAIVELQLGLLQASVGVEPGGDAHVKHAADLILAQRDEVDARMVFQAHSVLAEVALYDGRFDLVGPHLNAAIALQHELRDRLPLDGHLQTVMAWYLDDIGQASAARQLLLQVREELSQRLSSEHPYVAAVDDALVTSYLSEGRWQEAEQWVRTFGGRRPELSGDAVDALAALLMAKEQYVGAESLLERRYAQIRATPRSDQYRLVVYSLFDQLARAKSGLHKWGEAKAHFERAIDTLSNGNASNPYLAATRARYGLCLLSLGDRSGAAKQAELASKALKDQRMLSARFREPLAQLMARLNDAH